MFAGLSKVTSLNLRANPLKTIITRTATYRNGQAESVLTLGANLGTNTVSVSAAGIEQVVTFDAIAAPPMALTGIQVEASTPILAVTGSIVSSVDGASLPRLLGSGFRVTIKNLSTGKADTAVTDDDSVGYQLTFVELETGRRHRLEIRLKSQHNRRTRWLVYSRCGM